MLVCSSCLYFQIVCNFYNEGQLPSFLALPFSDSVVYQKFILEYAVCEKNSHIINVKLSRELFQKVGVEASTSTRRHSKLQL